MSLRFGGEVGRNSEHGCDGRNNHEAYIWRTLWIFQDIPNLIFPRFRLAVGVLCFLLGVGFIYHADRASNIYWTFNGIALGLCFGAHQE